jgi:hypothetical protein
MRTKTVVLAALCGLIGASAAEAQSVYSVNAVGYVNIAFKAQQYQMFSNPLNAPTNSIANLFPSPPDFSEIFTWGPSGYTVSTYYSFAGGWNPDSTITLNPGQGAFFYPAADFTQTFVGEVPQGNLTNSYPTGYSIVSSMVPQAGGLDTLGLGTVADFDEVMQWTQANGFVVYTYYSFAGGWNPSVPQLAVGESVFVLSANGGNWTRTFNINN